MEEELITDEEYSFNVGNIFFSFSCIEKNNKFSQEQHDGLAYECRYCNHINTFDFNQMKDNFHNNYFKRKCVNCNIIYNIEKFDFFKTDKSK